MRAWLPAQAGPEEGGDEDEGPEVRPWLVCCFCCSDTRLNAGWLPMLHVEVNGGQLGCLGFLRLQLAAGICPWRSCRLMLHMPFLGDQCSWRSDRISPEPGRNMRRAVTRAGTRAVTMKKKKTTMAVRRRCPSRRTNMRRKRRTTMARFGLNVPQRVTIVARSPPTVALGKAFIFGDTCFGHNDVARLGRRTSARI